MDGIVNILKPTGMTSHDVVSRVRRIFGQKKVGHTGTLDPNAAGVLPICLGKGTKVSEVMLGSRKKYRVELTLGIETDTYDSFGQITGKGDPAGIKKEDIIAVVESFAGEQMQVPPIYSALKVNGKKLYELARKGVSDVEIKARKIHIYDISIVSIEGGRVMFDVECSKGTYVRSICSDIGKKLGCGAYMSFLLRVFSGPFNIENSVTLEELQKAVEEGEAESMVMEVDSVLTEYQPVEINRGALKSFVNGATIYSKGIISKTALQTEGEIVRVYCDSKFYGLAAVSIENGITLKCCKLLA